MITHHRSAYTLLSQLVSGVQQLRTALDSTGAASLPPDLLAQLRAAGAGGDLVGETGGGDGGPVALSDDVAAATRQLGYQLLTVMEPQIQLLQPNMHVAAEVGGLGGPLTKGT